MKRVGSEDVYYCFECIYFTEDEKCRRLGIKFDRRGWQESCDYFKGVREGENHETDAE